MKTWPNFAYHFDDSRTLQYIYARWSTFSDRFHNVSFTMQSHDHNWSLALSLILWEKRNIEGCRLLLTHVNIHLYFEEMECTPNHWGWTTLYDVQLFEIKLRDFRLMTILVSIFYQNINKDRTNKSNTQKYIETAQKQMSSLF